MLGQNVVDPLLSLLDAGLPGGLEDIGEEILEVLVRQILLGRDEVVLVLWVPLEFVDSRETARVQCEIELQVSMVLREPDRSDSKIFFPNRFPRLAFVAILLGFLGLREKRWLSRDRDPSRRSLTLAISSLDWHFLPRAACRSDYIHQLRRGRLRGPEKAPQMSLRSHKGRPGPS